jgi:predicted transcriptional regulator
MDIIYAAGRASAADVRDAMADPPSYSSVRALLRILVEKGHLKHLQDGPRYVYLPKVSRQAARRSAMQHLLRTFFDDSAEDAVAALLDTSELNDDELKRLARKIDQARKEGR